MENCFPLNRLQLGSANFNVYSPCLFDNHSFRKALRVDHQSYIQLVTNFHARTCSDPNPQTRSSIWTHTSSSTFEKRLVPRHWAIVKGSPSKSPGLCWSKRFSCQSDRSSNRVTTDLSQSRSDVPKRNPHKILDSHTAFLAYRTLKNFESIPEINKNPVAQLLLSVSALRVKRKAKSPSLVTPAKKTRFDIASKLDLTRFYIQLPLSDPNLCIPNLSLIGTYLRSPSIFL